MKLHENPFILTGYKSPAYFCDRDQETGLLINYIKNRNNVTLFAFRRLGKTGLLNHTFYKLRNEKGLVCIYVDVFDTTDKSEFINKLATSIYNALPPKTSLGSQIIKAIQSLRPTISFDELTGLPTISLATTEGQNQQSTIESLFSFLDNQDLKVVFAIDEFQQILKYPEDNMEAVLRTQMQKLNNTSFIFCGSNQKMMHEIFNDAARPFFASCTYMHLGFIEEKEFRKFIIKQFKKFDKKIDKDAIEFISSWTMRHTFYTQSFSHAVFSNSGEQTTLADVKRIAAQTLVLQEGKFYQYRSLLTASQWKLLKAIAKETRVSKPQSKDFISKYKLSTPSIVKRSLEALVKKEMILQNTSVEKPYYEVYDKFLLRWLQTK